MKVADLRALNAAELTKRENELREEMFDLNVRHNTGVLEKTSELRRIRKDLARVLTVREEIQKKGNE
jgi:large subunit ribosomal protein L29